MIRCAFSRPASLRHLAMALLLLVAAPCRTRKLATDSYKEIAGQGTGSLLKKPSMAFSTSATEKRGFRLAPVVNGLQPSKMSVHPCTGRSLPKNCVFQQFASLSGTAP
jgi:hypothetical protein